MTTIVPGCGPLPCPILLCGEMPGMQEAAELRPFVGKSGREQERYLGLHGVTSKLWYRTNVVKEYLPGNPDPTPEQLVRWTPVLKAEIDACQPRLIVAVGRFAAQWFLGDDATMDLCHGLPHKPGTFDLSRSDRGGGEGVIILPIYHPAAGLHNNDMRPAIAWDYSQVARYATAVKRGHPIHVTHDEYAGNEHYIDAGGDQVATLLHDERPREIAIDTEFDTAGPWSVQLTWEAGEAYVLRCSQRDFSLGARGIQAYLDTYKPEIDYHFALVDAFQCRRMGIETNRCPWWDSGYAAYLLRIETQGLKHLAWRWCRMRMVDYMDVVGDTCHAARVDYLYKVIAVVEEHGIRPPATIETLLNDGSHKRTKPKSIAVLVRGLLRDINDDKRDKDGNPVDIRARWKGYRDELKRPVERLIGPLPSPSLEHVPLADAVHYAGRDSDATYRLRRELQR